MESDDEDAIQLWIAFGYCLNVYLRNPEKIPLDSKMKIRHLTSTLDRLCKSSFITLNDFQKVSDFQQDPHPLIFRAVWGPYAKYLNDCIGNEISTLEPNPGFESWTADLDIAIRKFINENSNYNIILITDCIENEQALFIGGEAYEILFPRKMAWRIVKYEIVEKNGITITFIYIKKRDVPDRD